MVDSLIYFLFQSVLHNLCNKGCGMYYRVCRMMHIKDPLLLIVKIAQIMAAGFFSCYFGGLLRLTPNNHKCVIKWNTSFDMPTLWNICHKHLLYHQASSLSPSLLPPPPPPHIISIQTWYQGRIVYKQILNQQNI